ncbi:MULTISPECIES: VCBS domain-containing protein [Methylobacter]
MAINTTSFTNTPQAGDDLLLSSKTGLNEDSLNIVYLDVMSNDLGGNAKTLYSLDNGIEDDGKTGADLLIQDIAKTESLSTDTSLNGAKIWISNGKVGYDANTFSADFQAKLQHLAQGESLTDSFTYAIRLGNGTLSWATATVQIAGKNDAVTITLADTTGAVVEDAASTPDSNDSQTATGSISFNDIDLSDTHTATFVKSAGHESRLGTFSLTPVAEAANAETGSVAWTYTLNNADAQYLAEGQTVTEVYTVKINDGHGSTATQKVSITITGTNDAVNIRSGVQAGTVTEDGALRAGTSDDDHESTEHDDHDDEHDDDHDEHDDHDHHESDEHHEHHEHHEQPQQSAHGVIKFTDADQSDTHTATVNNNGVSALGALTLQVHEERGDDDGEASHGSVAWTYTLNNDAAQSLAAGEQVTEVFEVTVSDGHGSTKTETVTITVNGTNDAPVVTNAESQLLGSVKEDDSLFISGQLSASDVDHGATQTWSVQNSAVGAYGSIAVDAATGQWTYTLANDAGNVQALAVGESHDETFTIRVDDGQGGSVDQTVTVTVNGTNDAAVLSSATADLIETNEVLSTSGTLTISDIDSAATFVAQVDQAGLYGTFNIGADGAWTYVANSAHDEFAEGITYTDTFAVTSADGTATNVTVNIQGTNDVAVLSSAAVVLDETNAALSTSGVLSISDVDNAAQFIAQDAAPGSNGLFSIDADGNWSYTANSAFDNLNAGDSVSDTFIVKAIDGTETSVKVIINGTNDAAVLSSAIVALDETNAALSTSGVLSISDVDNAAQLIAQDAAPGSNGLFSIDADGNWSYIANSAFDNLNVGDSISDTFIVKAIDGTETSVKVTINGTNDAAVLSSTTANLTESNAALTTSGTLTISDIDSAATFVAQVNQVGSYGTFNVGTNGAWTYAANSAHNEFVAGATYTDTFAVTSADGTATSVTVNILGTNDAAVLSTATTNLTETNAALATSGTLTISDVDSAAAFVAQTGVAGSYGTFNIGTDGAWTYVAGSAHNEFVAGTTYADTFAVTSADGTATSVKVNILGTNDAAVLSTATANLTETDAALTTSGALTISDVDSAATFVARTGVVGSYGTFNIGTNGAWTYTAGNAHNEFAAGATYTDTFAVTSADGTATSVTVNILGTNDAPVFVTTGALLDFNGSVNLANYQGYSLSGFNWYPYDFGDGDNSMAYTYQSMNISGTVDGIIKRVDGADFSLDSLRASSYIYQNDYHTTTMTGYNNGALVANQTISLIPGVYQTFAFGSGWSNVDEVRFDSGYYYTFLDNVVLSQGNAQANSVIEQITPIANLSVSNVLNFSDADLTDVHLVSSSGTPIGNVLGSLSAVKTADTTGTGVGGKLTWTYTVSASAVEYLAAGQTKVESFNITVDDQHGGIITKQIDVVITGTNDAPVVTAVDVTGAVTEMGTAVGNLSDSGIISFTDADLSDAHSLSSVTPSAGALGTLTANVSTDTTGSGTGGAVTWNYSVAASAVEYLAAGQTRVETFTFNVLDGHGGSVPRTVSVTVTGTNDAPVVTNTAAALVGSVKEDASLIATGQLSATDLDQGSVMTWSVQGNATGTYGAITVDNTGKWVYTLNNNAANVQAMAAGESHNDVFTVRVTDDKGALVDQTVTVTANGSNETTLTGTLTVDNSFELYVSTNDSQLGTLLATGSNWAAAYNFAAQLTHGVSNYVHIVAHNVGGPGGLLGQFSLSDAQFAFANSSTVEYTNATDWKVSLSGFGGTYSTPVNEGVNGVGPWGYISPISGSSNWIWNYNSIGSGDFNNEYFSMKINPIVFPAGVAGEDIQLAINDASLGLKQGLLDLTVSGLPSGWVLNSGLRLDDGSWSVQTANPSTLAIKAPADFSGAMLVNISESWINADGTTGTTTIMDNVEVYAPGAPIFAWSGDDNLTGSAGADLFALGQPIGNVTVFNFDASADKIDLMGFAGITGFADIQRNLSVDADGNALITLADGQTIILKGIDPSALNASDFVFNETPVTHNTGNMVVGDGAMLPLGGIIDNSGSIALQSTGDATRIELIMGGVSLQGHGHVTLTDNDSNIIFGATSDTSLTNVDNIISGAGQLGQGQLILDNQSIIVADGTHALTIDTGANTVINSGTLESTGTGGLIINSAVSNSGLLWAHGGDLIVNGAVNSGSALIDNGGDIEFADASSANVIFGAGSSNILKLDDADRFTGSVSDLNAGEAIDLANFSSDNATMSYADNADHSGGTLSITNGAHEVVNITLVGQYLDSGFTSAADGSAGTMISYQ